MTDTNISWTHIPGTRGRTWNPTRGCSRTIVDGSARSGCGDGTGGGCYAERTAARFCGPGQPYEGLVRLTSRGPRWTGEVRLVRARLRDPLRWRERSTIFVNSMSDLFHPGFSDADIDDVVAVMMVNCLHESRGGHVMQTLTKRSSRMRDYLSDPRTQGRVAAAAARMMDQDPDYWHDAIAYRGDGLRHPLLWWGVSCEHQAAMEERGRHLLDTPAWLRFLSCEPLIGPVDAGLTGCFHDTADLVGDGADEHQDHGQCGPRISWVIAGCESGPGSRSCEVDWLRSLRDECARTGTAFFLKQAKYVDGNRGTRSPIDARPPFGDIEADFGAKWKPGNVIETPFLDGVQHRRFPVPSMITVKR